MPTRAVRSSLRFRDRDGCEVVVHAVIVSAVIHHAKNTHMRFSVWPLISTRKLRTTALGLLLGLLVVPAMVSAEDSAPESDRETIKALLHRVEQLEARVSQLEAQQTPSPQRQSQASTTPQTSAPAPIASELAPEPERGGTMEQRMDTRTLVQIRGFGDMTF